MKVKLNIELDLPDECASFSDAELTQLLFDEYVNYVTVKHHQDGIRWCAAARVGSDDEDATKKLIFEHHKCWGEIGNSATFDFARVEEN